MVKWIKIAGSLTLAVVLLAGAISYIHVNQKYPGPSIHVCRMNEELTVQGYRFRVMEAQMLRFDKFVDQYGDPRDYGVGVYADEYDTHFLLIRISVDNVTDETKEMPPILYFTLQSPKGGFSTNCDLPAMLHLYEDNLDFLNGELRPGESVEALVPFSIDANLLSIYDNGLKLEDFIYVITQYPEKNYYTLQ